MSGHWFPPHASCFLCVSFLMQRFAQALFSNEASFLSRYSFADVVIYLTLMDSLCQVLMYSKWEFSIT